MTSVQWRIFQDLTLRTITIFLIYVWSMASYLFLIFEPWLLLFFYLCKRDVIKFTLHSGGWCLNEITEIKHLVLDPKQAITIKGLFIFHLLFPRVRKGKARTKDSFIGLGELNAVINDKARMRTILQTFKSPWRRTVTGCWDSCLNCPFKDRTLGLVAYGSVPRKWSFICTIPGLTEGREVRRKTVVI